MTIWVQTAFILVALIFQSPASVRAQDFSLLIKKVTPSSCPPTDSPKGPPIPKSLLCKNPAYYVCDPKYNSVVKKAVASSYRFNSIRDDAEAKIATTYGSSSCRSSVLTREDKIKCETSTEEIIAKQVYTPDRIPKATAIFKRAQTAIVSFLDSQKIFLNAADTEQLKILQLMKDKILQTQVVFGPTKKGTSSYLAENETSTSSNVVTIQGMILDVDAEPEKLYSVLLHEISHTIGPINDFRKDDSYSTNPFQKQMNCLKNSKSIGAKSGDLACVNKLVEKYKKMNASSANYFLRLSKALALNNDEAFADWIATESYAQERKSALISLTGIHDSTESVDLAARFEGMPELAAYLSEPCAAYNSVFTEKRSREENLDAHPIMEDRLNSVIFANPILRKSIGCETETQASRSEPMYCGDENLKAI
jgi:hypothetical protein